MSVRLLLLLCRLLEQLLAEDTFHKVLGRGTLYLLTDGDALVSFLTLAERDCIDDASLAPWIGFVHTSPEYRGRRCAGVLLEHAVRMAGENGAKQVYICRKLYHAPLVEEGFVEDGLAEYNYPQKDFHEMYIAEIIKVLERA